VQKHGVIHQRNADTLPKESLEQGFLASLNTQRYGVKTILLKPLNEWF